VLSFAHLMLNFAQFVFKIAQFGFKIAQFCSVVAIFCSVATQLFKATKISKKFPSKIALFPPHHH